MKTAGQNKARKGNAAPGDDGRDRSGITEGIVNEAALEAISGKGMHSGCRVLPPG